nr:ribonuclease III domain-containing protein [Cyanobacterium stanieri]
MRPAKQVPSGSPPKSNLRENNQNEVINVRENQSLAKIPQSSLKQISPISLAYIGDAIYELHIRTHYLIPCLKIADHHHKVVQQVRAETQAKHLQKLYPILNEEEKTWVKRGRNSVKKSPRKLAPGVYQQATGFETLLGYLYISNPPRLDEILTQIQPN